MTIGYYFTFKAYFFDSRVKVQFCYLLIKFGHHLPNEVYISDYWTKHLKTLYIYIYLSLSLDIYIVYLLSINLWILTSGFVIVIWIFFYIYFWRKKNLDLQSWITSNAIILESKQLIFNGKYWRIWWEGLIRILMCWWLLHMRLLLQ